MEVNRCSRTEEARQRRQNDRSGFQGQKRLSGHCHKSGWVTKDGGISIMMALKYGKKASYIPPQVRG